MMDNPLLQTWTTPFGIPPFDRIKAEHFEPAFEVAIAEHLVEIAAIAGDTAPPTFANTMEALERSGRTLGRVGAVFGNLSSSLGGDALEAVRRVMAPVLAEHGSRVALDPGVFARVAGLFAVRHDIGLDEDQMRLLERAHLGYLRSGAALDEASKQRLTAISMRVAALHTAFGQNVLHDEKAWSLPLSEADMVGLPSFVRDGAAAAAQERGLEGHVVTLSRSLVEPFLTFCERRDLRRVAYAAWVERGCHAGEHDNRVLIPEILALRRERAGLLGFDDFAAFRLADTMAGTAEAVNGLLDEVWAPARRKSDVEAARLLAVAREEGFNGTLEAWDWLFYAERVRRADHALDEAALKPFFPFEGIQQAAFDTATRLFQLEFKPLDVPVYHPDVRAYEVRDAAGHVGVFIADPFARPDKRSGAWMSSFRDQEAMDEPVSPIIVNNNNFARSEPTLLSMDDARTLFHEFGHGLHGLLSQVRYPSQSGTSVRRDFVELPSQIYEHWMELPETLERYCRHVETGEPLPADVIARLMAARGFNQGFDTVSYTASAMLDMALHLHPDPATMDVDAVEAGLLAQIGMPAAIGIRHRAAHFQHLFDGGGYAAGYYSYLWAAVLDTDGFDAFTEAGDPFDERLAAGLRSILSAGDTRDPMALYAAFRGRGPSTAALLRHRELVPA